MERLKVVNAILRHPVAEEITDIVTSYLSLQDDARCDDDEVVLKYTNEMLLQYATDKEGFIERFQSFSDTLEDKVETLLYSLESGYGISRMQLTDLMIGDKYGMYIISCLKKDEEKRLYGNSEFR